MRTPYGAAQYMRARHLRPGDALALSLWLALLVQKYTYGLKRPPERHLRAGECARDFDAATPTLLAFLVCKKKKRLTQLLRGR
jgi:hypothetical protein